MIAYTRERVSKLLRIEFVRFCIVGGTGFIINLVILTGLHKLFGVPIFMGQLIAAEIALFSNFMLHHHWTYKDNKVKKSMFTLVVQFHATSWPAIVGSAVMLSVFVKVFHLGNFVSLIIIAFIALIWNFVWSKFVVWRDVTEDQVKEIVS